MLVKNHRLEATTPNEKIVNLNSANARELIDPDYLVVHYTATDDAAAAINWFMNTSSNPDKIAAHIVLDTDGTITQLVPFNRRANHAGSSIWDKTDQFNFHSIGIEIVNPGFVEKLSNGSFRRRITNTNFKTYPAATSNRIIKANHKHKFWTQAENKHWFKFPQPQLDALYSLSSVLINHYQLITAVGHDDISTGRKPDPGPAFPWDEFKTKVFGATNNNGKIFLVSGNDGANFRPAPTTNSTPFKKLPKNYEVGLIETDGQWCKVYLTNDPKDVIQKSGKVQRAVKSIGWIHASLLSLKPGQ